ncbi:MAG: hypothetical protein ACRD2C_03720, partial [Acidimicrobiales bacterium]
SCGDDDDDADTGSGNFCDEAGDIYQDLVASADFDQERFEQLLGAMEDLDPPAAVADDWQATVDAMGTLADQTDIETLDPNEPEVAGALERAANALDGIGTYLTDECELDLSGG